MAGRDGTTYFTSIGVQRLFVTGTATSDLAGSSGQVLTSGGSTGAIAWATLGSSTIGLASTSASGLMGLGAQRFAGSKVFVDTISAGNLTGTNTGDATLSSSSIGISRSGQVFTGLTASTSQAGMLTFDAQRIGGNKTFTGSVTASNLSGTNTGDQTITLTGNVTGSGTGSFATTIANSAVTNVMVAATAAISGSKIVAATSAVSGVVTTASQVFAGNKTIRGTLTISSTLNVPSVTASRNLVTNSLSQLVASTVTKAQIEGVTTVSRVRDEVGAGHGSTNTKIRRIETSVVNTGSAITRAVSATNGNSYTINSDGVYSIMYGDGGATGGRFGISISSSQLTTNIQSITNTDRAAMSQTSGAVNADCVWVGRLTNGAVIRPHTDGSPNGTNTDTYFEIQRINF